jgi:hypothetical protein
MLQLDNQVAIPTSFIGPQGNLTDLANVKYNAGSGPSGEFIESATLHATYVDAELVNAKISFGTPYMGILYSNENGTGSVANGISVSTDGNSLTITENLTVHGDFNVVGANNVIISDPILELGNQSTMEMNTGVIFSRPMDEGNVGMVYITDQFSEYDNTLVIGYHNGWAGTDDIQPNVEANITVEVLGNVVAANYFGNAAQMISLTGMTEGTYGNANVSNGSANILVMNVDANGYISNVSNLVILTSGNLEQTTDFGNITTNTVIFANTTNSFVTYGTAGIMNVDSHHTLALGNESHTGNLYISGNISIDTDGTIVRIGAGAGSAIDTELTTPLTGMISLGTRAGREYQNSNAIAIGLDAGFQSQNSNAVSIGTEAGQFFQDKDAISVGVEAGRYSQNTRSLSIGTQAGMSQQGSDAVAMGYRAGKQCQEPQAFAVGVRAGEITQREKAMALGVRAGYSNQGVAAVSIGYAAGRENQGTDAVAIGTESGRVGQGSSTVAIGFEAGRSAQLANAVAIGFEAGRLDQGANSVAIGYKAGTTSQKPNSIIINATGEALEATEENAVYIAPIRFKSEQVSRLLTSNSETGELVQANVMVSNANVGVNLTDVLDITEVLSVGGNVKADYYLGNANTLVSTTDVGDGVYGYVSADANGYGSNLLSISVVDGRISEVYNTYVPSTNLTLQQVTDWGNITSNTMVSSNTKISLLTRGNVAVATTTAEPLHSLVVGQDQHFEGDILISGTDTKVSIGQNAGGSTGGTHTVAIGVEAGQTNQGDYAVALGRFSGRTDQGRLATGVGVNTGYDGQNAYATAIGNEAGFCGQHSYATAIGDEAGRNEQGSYSVAMGFKAGFTGQHDNTVVINASGAELDTKQGGSFYISPVRNEAVKTSNLVTYENSNGEVTVSNLVYENGNLSVGNTTAQYEVDVLGNIHFTQNIYGNGLFLNTTTDLLDGTYSMDSNEFGSNTMSLTIVNGRLSDLGNTFIPSGGLGVVSNIGNAVSNVVQFINAETSFVTLGNVGISNGAVVVMGAHLVVGQDDTPYTSNMIHLSGNTRITQEGNIVSVGTNSLDLDDGAVAIGWDAGGEGKRTVAVGYRAGADTTGQVGNRVAVGYEAAFTGQQKNAVAIGYAAGAENQGSAAIAVGVQSGNVSQGAQAFAAGSFAGRFDQGSGAVALGAQAGNSAQGSFAIAVGKGAGITSQPDRSIILNASGETLNATKANAFHVSNVLHEDTETGFVTAYNRTTKEVFESNIYFENGYIGINNTSPEHRLAVGGNVWVRSNVYSTNVNVSQRVTISEFHLSNIDNGILAIHDGAGVGFINVNASTQNVAVSSNLLIENTATATNLVAVGTTSDFIWGGREVVVGNTEPQNANLQVWGNVHSNGNITSETNIVAAYFHGDGSNLTGLASNLHEVMVNGNVTQDTLMLETNAVSILTEGCIGVKNTNPDFMLTLGDPDTEAIDGIMFSNNIVIAVDQGDRVSVGPREAGGEEGVQVGAYANTGTRSIAIGYGAGSGDTGEFNTSIGYLSGNSAQESFSISVGHLAGQTSQMNGAISLGAFAGQVGQGSRSIAIGMQAGITSQHDRSIVLNANTSALDTTAVDSFYVSSVRLDDAVGTASNVMIYDVANLEVLRSNVQIEGSNVRANTFYGDGGLLSNVAGNANALPNDLIFTSDGDSLNGTHGNVTYDYENTNLKSLGNIEVSGNIYSNLVTDIINFNLGGSNPITGRGKDLANIVNAGNTLTNNTIHLVSKTFALAAEGRVSIGSNVDNSTNLHVTGNIHSNGNITTETNVVAAYLHGDGSNLTGIVDSSTLQSAVDAGNVCTEVVSLTNSTLSLSTAGPVGVGTASPSSVLSVVGSTPFSPNPTEAGIHIGENTAGYAAIEMIAANNKAYLDFSKPGAGSHFYRVVSNLNDLNNFEIFGPGNSVPALSVEKDNSYVGIHNRSPTEALDVGGNINATGAVKASSLNLAGLPTSSIGLTTGDVYSDGGILKIV